MTNEQETNESPIEQAETALVKTRLPPGEVRGIADAVEHLPHTIVDPFAPVFTRTVPHDEVPGPSAADVRELAGELERERRENGNLRAKVAELEALLKPNAVG